MKLAIIGSRSLTRIDLEKYIPSEATEIVSGGAKGIDSLAKDFADRRGIRLTEFLPEYKLYGKAAPLRRNEKIAKYSDEAIVFWDGKSKGTKYTIELFRSLNKKIEVHII